MEVRDKKIADEQAMSEFELQKLELQARNTTITTPRQIKITS